MNGFLLTLIVILVIGLTITQLALLKWTDTRLWNLLHICLFFVSTNPLSLTPPQMLVLCSRTMARSEKGSSLGPVPIQRLVHKDESP